MTPEQIADDVLVYCREHKCTVDEAFAAVRRRGAYSSNNNWLIEHWQARALKAEASLAQASQARTDGGAVAIPMSDGYSLHRPEGKFQSWRLMKDGEEIRHLSRFEAEFVDAALARQAPAPLSQAVTEDARDGERLDWLESTKAQLVQWALGYNGSPNAWLYAVENGNVRAWSKGMPSLRAAIDAARAATSGNEER